MDIMHIIIHNYIEQIAHFFKRTITVEKNYLHNWFIYLIIPYYQI